MPCKGFEHAFVGLTARMHDKVSHSAPRNLSALHSLSQAIDLSRKLGLCDFNPGDDTSDQLVVLSGPLEAPFLVPQTFHAAEVVALVFGDEAATLKPPTGYRGTHTIAYRSTKVRQQVLLV